MVRHVHHGRFVGSGLVVDAELVVGRERVGHLDIQVAREPVLSVGMEVMQHEFVVRGRYHVPYHAVYAQEPAVQRLPVIVHRQGVFRAVEREVPLCDAVGVGAYHGAEEPFARVVYVAADVFVAQYDVLVAAFAVGCPERYDAGAVIGDLHGDVARMERVECDGFAVDGGLECLFGQQREFRFLHAARSQQRHAE